ncbi:hypothetical protein PILCRDRAFT_92800 [Piloderma croceum F 1598]|uniref:Uncharacterized protein n=1 Tax=Piloderma croceum (strain F 1598) TaxID=765440 RepID=A0A0C3F1B7_PILCF|nr:hypothetical protein PILCRDRAFT_92800 [Piloderma croceum F 1598]
MIEFCLTYAGATEVRGILLKLGHGAIATVKLLIAIVTTWAACKLNNYNKKKLLITIVTCKLNNYNKEVNTLSPVQSISTTSTTCIHYEMHLTDGALQHVRANRDPETATYEENELTACQWQASYPTFTAESG